MGAREGGRRQPINHLLRAWPWSRARRRLLSYATPRLYHTSNSRGAQPKEFPTERPLKMIPGPKECNDIVLPPISEARAMKSRPSTRRRFWTRDSRDSKRVKNHGAQDRASRRFHATCRHLPPVVVRPPGARKAPGGQQSTRFLDHNARALEHRCFVRLRQQLSFKVQTINLL